MALHASLTIVDDNTQPDNLKYKDRMFGNKNESVSWEVVNRTAATTLYNITFANFYNERSNTAVDISVIFDKLVPIAKLAPSGSDSIKAKIKTSVANNIFSFDVIAYLTDPGTDPAAVQVTISDPEMEVCQDITLFGVNWDAIKSLKKAAPKKSVRKVRRK
jgi:hypothetical protein